MRLRRPESWACCGAGRAASGRLSPMTRVRIEVISRPAGPTVCSDDLAASSRCGFHAAAAAAALCWQYRPDEGFCRCMISRATGMTEAGRGHCRPRARRRAFVMPDHLCHVAREIVQRQDLHRACTASTARCGRSTWKPAPAIDAANLVKIQGIATAPRAGELLSARGLRQSLRCAHLVIGRYSGRVCLRRRRAQRNQTGRELLSKPYDATRHPKSTTPPNPRPSFTSAS